MIGLQKTMISKATVDRLPVYFRTLQQLKDTGIEVISSEELGRRIGFSPEQIRKDFAMFGEFGKKGVGYYVEYLISKINDILGLNRIWNTCIVGYGHLGNALAHHQNFSNLGFKLQAVFDADEVKIGQKVQEDVEIFSTHKIEEIIREKQIEIGIISVPAANAQQVADLLTQAGVKGIWNFSPTRIEIPSHVVMISEDLSIGLSTLSYYIVNQ